MYVLSVGDKLHQIMAVRAWTSLSYFHNFIVYLVYWKYIQITSFYTHIDCEGICCRAVNLTLQMAIATPTLIRWKSLLASSYCSQQMSASSITSRAVVTSIISRHVLCCPTTAPRYVYHHFTSLAVSAVLKHRLKFTGAKHFIGGAENAGHEIDGPMCWAWNCRTCKYKAEN